MIALKTFLLMLAMHESGGNQYAIGDNGDAVGAYQIHVEVIQDVNERYGTRYVNADRFNKVKSAEIATRYLKYWGGREGVNFKDGINRREAQVLARIWNGGPKGHERSCTVSYWERFKKQYSKT